MTEKVIINSEYTHILVAVDSSIGARIALRKAIQISKRNDAILTILHVVQVKENNFLDRFIVTNQSVKAEQRMMEKFVVMARNEKCKDIRDITRYGDPKHVIIKEACHSSQNIDLIVIGSTGTNSKDTFHIGSVTSFVTIHATCDVMIIKHE